jgi:hypothetical protein
MIETLALTCLAQTMFMEARGEPQAGQIAVGMVLYRRADFDPKTRLCRDVETLSVFLVRKDKATRAWLLRT